jgi:hypothetical protein
LTDQDLEKTGIASLGHRRKLLRAIAALNTGRVASAGLSASDAAAATPAAAPTRLRLPPGPNVALCLSLGCEPR